MFWRGPWCTARAVHGKWRVRNKKMPQLIGRESMVLKRMQCVGGKCWNVVRFVGGVECDG